MYHCIVVGAGPAGSAAAARLAQAGVRVLLLEKHILPRYKACAGAVSGRALNWLNLDFLPVVEDVISRVKVQWAKGDPQPVEYVSASPIAYLVMRSSFDNLLAQQAAAAGAELHDGETVKSIQVTEDFVEVRSAQSVYQAKVIIGADGACGVVAKQTGLYVPRASGIALEIEAELPGDELRNWRSTVLVSYGIPQHGYAWLFPKAQTASIGMGTFMTRRRGFLAEFAEFTASLGVDVEQQDLKAHPIPLGGRDRRFCRPRVLLAGDAAGLTDPLSGEGIAHALHSGSLAANHALAALESGDFSMAAYQTAIEEEINSQLKAAGRLAAIFYAYPKFFSHLFTTRHEVLQWYFELVQGQREYRDVWDLVKKLLAARKVPSLNTH
ncbi:MAG: geranylgeranyl reductase family protein [Firmicutes bacterium]|nr:geranylgeranyl reductase family protein [Bacillota bacterium]